MMKKKYRLNVSQLSKKELAYFECIGCKIDEFNVEVFDDCREWDAVRKIIYRHYQDPQSIDSEIKQSIVSDVDSIFTEKELMGAPYLNIICDSYSGGYPQPENKYKKFLFGIEDEMVKRSPDNFDLLLEHPQIAPFRFSSEPNWGKRNKGFTGVFWQETYVFVNNHCREMVFAPFGVKMRDVLKNKTGNPLETVFQLDPDVSPEPLDTKEIHYFDTPKKRRVFIMTPAFFPHNFEEIEEHMKGAGFYPPFTVDPHLPCCWTQEYFTNGPKEWFTLWRDMIISHDVYMKIREYKFTGLDYTPMLG